MPALETLLRRDRLIVGGGLLAVCVLSWLYLLAGAQTGMPATAMTTWAFPPPLHATQAAAPWDLAYWITMALMWLTMMIAMMVPSAAPTILLYASVHRHAQRKGQIESASIPTAAFVGGYLCAWLVFSLAATGLQWLLESAGVLHAMLMWSTHRGLSAAFLIAAGAYQLSPLKYVCLEHCRSPARFIADHWRRGHSGAARMGFEHGLYCVGCCWLLMTLLFAGGVMNLVWIAGLAIAVLVEKLAPSGHTIGQAFGVTMISAGAYLLMT
jgi:predicted metal-binding membrane protein